MIFSSYEFILGFLPVVYLVYLLLGKFSTQYVTKIWLIIASLFFYGFWDWNYMYLIVGSIAFNFSLGRLQLAAHEVKQKKYLLLAGLIFNLGLLSYFKYMNFFLGSLGLQNLAGNFEAIILPIGLSFYTFQQISYQIDAFRGGIKKYSIVDYALFVSFFPQLIAGPIVHHKEMLPQFSRRNFLNPKVRNLILGLCIFSVGVFKKTVLADNFAQYANPIFSAAADPSITLTFFEAWAGAISYTFQLYFDFSGYSDMAVGLGTLFGIKLPFNFYSPLKAQNMIELWRRWHISLTREIQFLLYNSISMSFMRYTYRRRFTGILAFLLSVMVPTCIVWAIVGLWHGAGNNFLFMGLFFGVCITWNQFCKQVIHRLEDSSKIKRLMVPPPRIACAITVFFFIIAMVIFRAENMSAVKVMYQAMFTTFGSPFAFLSDLSPLHLAFVVFGAFIIWVMPNTIQYFGRYYIGLDIFDWRTRPAKGIITWRMSHFHVTVCAVMLALALAFMSNNVNEFIYFDF